MDENICQKEVSAADQNDPTTQQQYVPPQAFYPPQQGAPIYQQQPYPYPAPPYTPQKKQKNLFPIEKRDLIFAVCAFGLALFGVIAGLWGKLNAGFTAAAVLAIVVFSIYLAKKKTFSGIFPLVCGIEAVLLSGVFTVTDEPRIRVFAVILLPCLAAVWFAGLAGYHIPDGDLGIISHLINVIFSGIGATPKSLHSVFSGRNPRLKHAGKILIGLLCAVPILLVVVPLLIRSDEAFSNLLGRIFADTGTRFLQVGLALLLTPFLLGFAFSLRKTTQKDKKESASSRGIDTVILTTALSVLSLCYLVYLFSQLAYFFSGFMGILPEGYGFSHAEYARRGFFELCAIAGINLVVLFTVLLICKKENGKPPVILRFFACFIGCFNLLLIGTAISKLALYIRTYGMTVMRIGTSAFAVFMSVVFLLLMLRYFIPKLRVLCAALPLAAAVILVLGLGNVNAFVAEYNYDLYITNKNAEIDVEYFGELGAAGAPYLVQLAESTDETIRTTAYHCIYTMIQKVYTLDEHFDPYISGILEDDYYKIKGKTYSNLSQFNIARNKMYVALDAFLEANPNFMLEQAKREEDYWATYWDEY